MIRFFKLNLNPVLDDHEFNVPIANLSTKISDSSQRDLDANWCILTFFRKTTVKVLAAEKILGTKPTSKHVSSSFKILSSRKKLNSQETSDPQIMYALYVSLAQTILNIQISQFRFGFCRGKHSPYKRSRWLNCAIIM